MATKGNEVHHPLFARLYLNFVSEADRRGGAEHRERLLEGLTVRVLEIGAGQGANFAYCPDTVLTMRLARRGVQRRGPLQEATG